MSNSSTDWDEVSFVIASRYREGVLGRLAAGPAMPSQIAADTGVDISHVSRAVGELRDRSLVELLVSEEKQKGRVYGITDRGSDIWKTVEDLENNDE
jgi:DNA-binding MarR family transcriptional regulator